MSFAELRKHTPVELAAMSALLARHSLVKEGGAISDGAMEAAIKTSPGKVQEMTEIREAYNAEIGRIGKWRMSYSGALRGSNG